MRPEYLIAPSILAADLARLGEEAVRVIDAGADLIHFDVMDNHFVPNLSFGPSVREALRGYGMRAPWPDDETAVANREIDLLYVIDGRVVIGEVKASTHDFTIRGRVRLREGILAHQGRRSDVSPQAA